MNCRVALSAARGAPLVIEPCDHDRLHAVFALPAREDGQLAHLLGARPPGRLATVGADGTPHVVPVGWSYSI